MDDDDEPLELLDDPLEAVDEEGELELEVETD